MAVVYNLGVIALVCGIISIVCLIIAIASNVWLSADGYKQGLWQECFWDVSGVEDYCQSNEGYEWMYAVSALCILGLIIVVVGVIFNGLGLYTKDLMAKKKWYKVAMWLMIAAVICVVIALFIFPAAFMSEIDERGKSEWYFDWAYGVAWGAAIFIFGAAMLLWIELRSTIYSIPEKGPSI